MLYFKTKEFFNNGILFSYYAVVLLGLTKKLRFPADKNKFLKFSIRPDPTPAAGPSDYAPEKSPEMNSLKGFTRGAFQDNFSLGIVFRGGCPGPVHDYKSLRLAVMI